MSTISDYFGLDDAEDTIRTICFFISLIIVTVAILFFVLIISHLHCFPKSPLIVDYQPEMDLGYVKPYSTLSASFATICIIVGFTIYPVCTRWSCWDPGLDAMYSILLLDSYTFAKFFLYMIFIGHLFNVYYLPLYQSPKWAWYFLWMLLIIMLTTTLILNMGYGLDFARGDFTRDDMLDSVEMVCSATYLIADSILSIFSMIMFLRPIYSRHFRNPVSPLSPNADKAKAILKKYEAVSVLQLIAALSYQISTITLIVLIFNDAPIGVRTSFNDICNLIMMIDCALLMICIHIGFARIQTVCNLQIT